MKSVSIALVLLSGIASAADLCTVTMRDAVIAPGQEAEIVVMLAVDFDSQAFSFGISHDPAELDIRELLQGEALAALNGGQGPWFWDAKLYEEDVACDQDVVQGLSIACIYSFGAVVINAPEGAEIARCRYAPVITTGSARLQFRDCMGTPPVSQNVADIAGQSFQGCVWADGSVHILGGDLSLTDGPVVDQGSSFSLKALLAVGGQAEVSGFSFAVRHDDAVLSLESISYDACADMVVLNGGSGPDFFNAMIYATGWQCGGQRAYGGSVECVVDNESVETIPAGPQREIASFTYSTRATGFPAVTDIAIADSGCIPGGIAPSVSILGGPPSAPTASATTVTVEASPFLRGDASQDGSVDISDAVCVLRRLFRGGCAGLTCLEAANTNGDGSLDIADAVYLLDYLFGGGPPLGIPFSACGFPVAFSVGCVEAPTCQ